MLNNNKTYDNRNLRDVMKTFNDGVLDVYKARERTLVEFKGRFCYCAETIGVNHFWEAYANKVNVDLIVSVPYNAEITSNDIVHVNDQFYKIVSMTYKNNRKPSYWRISLEKSNFAYENENIEIG